MQLHGDKFADYLAGQGITEQKVRNVVENPWRPKVTTKNQEDSYQSLENTEPIWFKLPVIIN